MKLHYIENNAKNYQTHSLPDSIIEQVKAMKYKDIIKYKNKRFQKRVCGYPVCIDNIENEDEWIYWIK